MLPYGDRKAREQLPSGIAHRHNYYLYGRMLRMPWDTIAW